MQLIPNNLLCQKLLTGLQIIRNQYFLQQELAIYHVTFYGMCLGKRLSEN